jgi:carbonic anhydrase
MIQARRRKMGASDHLQEGRIVPVALGSLSGSLRTLLDQHVKQEAGQREKAKRMQEVVARRSSGKRVDLLPKGEPQIFIEFACSDSRVVTPFNDPAERVFVVTLPLAGESIGEVFPYEQVAEVLPCIDGIVVQGHLDCGACKASAAVKKALASGQDHPYGGSPALFALTANVEADIEANVLVQMGHLQDRLGTRLREFHVPVIGTMNNIYAGPREPAYSEIGSPITEGFSDSAKARTAIATWRDIIAGRNRAYREAAEHSQHPSILWLTGLSLFDLLRRGIGSENEWTGDPSKGLVFKVGWQHPEDPSAAGSALYILLHDCIRQIVFTATQEDDLKRRMKCFADHPEIAAFLKDRADMQLVGLVIDPLGVMDREKLFLYQRC